MQYEACYLRFLMPRMRDSELGSKKRYAGLRQAPDGSSTLVFKGLEQVRSDWTRLAKDFQQTLFAQIFADQLRSADSIPCGGIARG
ncbi:DNA polymerase domain-containing protein [Nitrincola sp. A-D6]|uniref:DNA polymerase domain-containing protein n=1 Tax=Nitrincola sp. A-D6 TaxID=1545442 RepID=UPI0022865F49|nr:DNA polymerase domain-containing protein [Nitrincola sp. A-D6]